MSDDQDRIHAIYAVGTAEIAGDMLKYAARDTERLQAGAWELFHMSTRCPAEQPYVWELSVRVGDLAAEASALSRKLNWMIKELEPRLAAVVFEEERTQRETTGKQPN